MSWIRMIVSICLLSLEGLAIADVEEVPLLARGGGRPGGYYMMDRRPSSRHNNFFVDHQPLPLYKDCDCCDCQEEGEEWDQNSSFQESPRAFYRER